MNVHIKELSTNSLQCRGNVGDQIFGVRDFLICPDLENSLFIACSDMNVVSRIDSYFAGMRGKKKEDPIVMVGSLELWEEVSSDQSAYTKSWNAMFRSQAICICYCKELKLIAIGFDNGKIVVYKFASNKESPILLAEIKAHSGRVMNIWIDEANANIYSIGEDGNLKKIGLNSKEIVNTCKISKKLTDMKVDEENLTAYITDTQGRLHLITFKSVDFI